MGSEHEMQKKLKLVNILHTVGAEPPCGGRRCPPRLPIEIMARKNIKELADAFVNTSLLLVLCSYLNIRFASFLNHPDNKPTFIYAKNTAILFNKDSICIRVLSVVDFVDFFWIGNRETNSSLRIVIRNSN